jgi:TatD DNase family protein
MSLFDTHLHLDDEQFNGQRDVIVQRAAEAGVRTMVTVGTTAASSQHCLELARRFESVQAAVGIQPNYCAEAADGDWDTVLGLVEQPQVVALGETGLDRHWDYSPFPLQQDYFDRHLRLSQQTGLPFIVHMRDCGEEILQMLREAHTRGPLHGVMHSFTGDLATMQECLELGMHISFAGMVTYKKSDDLRSIATAVSDDRLLLETDAPWLSPHPCRGQRPNEPALLVHTAGCLAEARKMDFEVFSELVSSNAQAFFGRVESNR